MVTSSHHVAPHPDPGGDDLCLITPYQEVSVTDVYLDKYPRAANTPRPRSMELWRVRETDLVTGNFVHFLSQTIARGYNLRIGLSGGSASQMQCHLLIYMQVTEKAVFVQTYLPRKRFRELSNSS